MDKKISWKLGTLLNFFQKCKDFVKACKPTDEGITSLHTETLMASSKEWQVQHQSTSNYDSMVVGIQKDWYRLRKHFTMAVDIQN